jgi:hypothetical protein
MRGTLYYTAQAHVMTSTDPFPFLRTCSSQGAPHCVHIRHSASHHIVYPFEAFPFLAHLLKPRGTTLCAHSAQRITPHCVPIWGLSLSCAPAQAKGHPSLHGSRPSLNCCRVLLIAVVVLCLAEVLTPLQYKNES